MEAVHPGMLPSKVSRQPVPAHVIHAGLDGMVSKPGFVIVMEVLPPPLAPACVTVNVCPPTVMTPVRELALVLAVTA